MPRSILILYRTRPHRASAARAPRGQWRWRLFDQRNHRILGASSEGYRGRADAIANIERVLGLKLQRLSRADFFALPFSDRDRPSMPAFDTFRTIEAARRGYPRMTWYEMRHG